MSDGQRPSVVGDCEIERAHRYRDICGAHVSDVGGAYPLSERIPSCAASPAIEAERMEGELSEAEPVDIDVLGLERIASDLIPTIDQIVARRGTDIAQALGAPDVFGSAIEDHATRPLARLISSPVRPADGRRGRDAAVPRLHGPHHCDDSLETHVAKIEVHTPARLTPAAEIDPILLASASDAFEAVCRDGAPSGFGRRLAGGTATSRPPAVSAPRLSLTPHGQA